jgi:hypothetical protein
VFAAPPLSLDALPGSVANISPKEDLWKQGLQIVKVVWIGLLQVMRVVAFVGVCYGSFLIFKGLIGWE